MERACATAEKRNLGCTGCNLGCGRLANKRRLLTQETLAEEPRETSTIMGMAAARRACFRSVLASLAT